MIAVVQLLFGFIADIFDLMFATPFGDLPFSIGHFLIGVPLILIIIRAVLRLFGGDDNA